MNVSAKFKPQDLWIGAYWERTPPGLTADGYARLDVWVCVVPMLPVRLHFGPGKGRPR